MLKATNKTFNEDLLTDSVRLGFTNASTALTKLTKSGIQHKFEESEFHQLKLKKILELDTLRMKNYDFLLVTVFFGGACGKFYLVLTKFELEMITDQILYVRDSADGLNQDFVKEMVNILCASIFDKVSIGIEEKVHFDTADLFDFKYENLSVAIFNDFVNITDEVTVSNNHLNINKEVRPLALIVMSEVREILSTTKRKQ